MTPLTLSASGRKNKLDFLEQNPNGGVMADYSRFDATIIPWLQKVWDNHELIKQEVKKTLPDDLPRKEGAWLIYGYWSGPLR
jgi:hypothetical protein